MAKVVVSRSSIAPRLFLAAAMLGPAAAQADIRQAVETRTYAVSGRSGAELLDAMDRSGPRHGFLTRAIAQTKYKVSWSFDVVAENGRCHVRDADAVLSVTYVYPALTGKPSPALERRWRKFMAGVRKHEETHARLAREMVVAAQKEVKGLSVPEDWRCMTARREIKARVERIDATYEARQLAYDAREHADGGKVDRLVRALVVGP